jgi:hypothetical protein
MAQCFLQPPDLLAHRRLGTVDALARPGEAACIDDRDEAAEKIEIKHANLFRLDHLQFN